MLSVLYYLARFNRELPIIGALVGNLGFRPIATLRLPKAVFNTLVI